MTHVPNLGNVTGQTTTFYHGDHLGSSRLLSSADGYPTWQGTYYPYGMEYTPPGSTDNTATVNTEKFAGMGRDAEPTNDYTMFRSYGNAMGRWLSPDPLGGDISDPQSLNRYAYVGNEPVDRYDPWGLSWFDDVVNAGVRNPGPPSMERMVRDSACSSQALGARCADLPGFMSELQRELIRHESIIHTGLDPFNHPLGPGWTPYNEAHPDQRGAGCWTNSLNDLNWCPGTGLEFHINVTVGMPTPIHSIGPAPMDRIAAVTEPLGVRHTGKYVQQYLPCVLAEGPANLSKMSNTIEVGAAGVVLGPLPWVKWAGVWMIGTGLMVPAMKTNHTCTMETYGGSPW